MASDIFCAAAGTLVTGSVQAPSTSPGRVTSRDTQVSPNTSGPLFRIVSAVRSSWLYQALSVVPCVNCAPMYCVMNGRVMASNSSRFRLALAYSNWYDHVVPSVEWIRRSGRAPAPARLTTAAIVIVTLLRNLLRTVTVLLPVAS